MTTAPTPGPGSPTSPADLSRLVDDLEERGAAEVARERHSNATEATDAGHPGADDAPQQQDLTGDVPGAPEPPD